MTEIPEDIMKAATAVVVAWKEGGTQCGLSTLISSAILAERKRCAKELAGAEVYARNLAISLHEKHYGEITTWKPLEGDLIGILTQIDNMTAELTRE